jgi:large subunit ribosomal protein L6
MSRVAKAPVEIPAGVEVTLNGQEIKVKGANGELSRVINDAVTVAVQDNLISTTPKAEVAKSNAQAGTARALINNMIVGVSQGFQKQLKLIGVGYRAQASGQKVTLNLGFSHPIEVELPKGISAETPSQTDLVLKGVDKQLVGQIAANIRSFRPPEPYKGKGVRYVDENVRRKEAKKK